MRKRHLVFAAPLIAAAALAPAFASAQGYPNKTVKIVAPVQQIGRASCRERV